MDIFQGRMVADIKDDQSSVTALLIHDVFGGEILKTHRRKTWHFYNRINGLRIDFSKHELGKSGSKIRPDDLPSSRDEASNYIESADYMTFYMRFIRVFEETIGLRKRRSESKV